jgi:acetylornithine deacetylase/succinyl-diaminopimelate desuccinylase-like protein
VPGLDASLNLLRMDPPFAPSRNTGVADLLSALTGNRPSTIAFGSEAPHLAGLTAETVVFGAGDMTVAHKTGEHVLVSELLLCTKYLQAVLQQVCGT